MEAKSYQLHFPQLQEAGQSQSELQGENVALHSQVKNLEEKSKSLKDVTVRASASILFVRFCRIVVLRRWVWMGLEGSSLSCVQNHAAIVQSFTQL